MKPRKSQKPKPPSPQGGSSAPRGISSPAADAGTGPAVPQERSALSYASYFKHPVKRRFVRAVELASGQPRLKRLYEGYRNERAGPDGAAPFFEAAVRLLELDVAYDRERLAAMPDTGPLVVVANHPFGVLDGVVICFLVGLRRQDFKILTNAALDAAPEAREHLLPIDFNSTREAQQINLQSRKAALSHLEAGGCIIVFPAGGVSTAPAPLSRTASDAEWKPFTAKLITRSGASVTPVFFEGQNGRLFQIASHISAELRLALIFREVRKRIGTVLPVHLGETLTPEDVEDAGKRADLMAFLRAKVYGMASLEDERAYTAAAARLSGRPPRSWR